MQIILQHLAGEDGDVDLILITEELLQAMRAAAWTPRAIIASLVAAEFTPGIPPFNHLDATDAEMAELIRRLEAIFETPFSMSESNGQAQ